MPGGFRQKLTIPQFAALIQFNWNDPAELAEIQKALPDDAAADDLRESAAARLAKLKAEEGEKVVLASRSHRRLNIKQLVTLSEVYWDDPGKLAEILDALRARLEPEADALFRSVARRIDLLKNDPKAAAAERPPSEAERAAGAAPDAATDGAATADARRRVPVIVLAGVVAIAVAAWFLWRHDKDREADRLAEPGAEILAQGERPEDQLKPSGETAAPLTSVPPRAAPPDRAPPSPLGGTKARADSEREMGAGRGGAGRGTATRDEPDIHDAPSAGAAGRSADNKAREPAAPRAGAAGRSAPSSATRGPAPMPVSAEAGVAIEEAHLSCYRSSPDPESCSEPAAAGRRDVPAPAARAAAAAGGTGAPPPKGGASADPPDAAGASPAKSARHDPLPPARGGGSSGVSSGAGTASGGGAAPDSGAGVLTSAARSKSRRIPGGGGGAAVEAGQKIERPPTSRDAMPQAPSASDCPSEPAAGRVVFILDGSISMGLPLDVDAALEDELDEGIRRHDPDARREYRALLAEAGPKRITRAREAFTAAAADLPAGVDLGLVVFQECRDIRKVGVFDAARRGAAVDYIKALIPKGRTPLADSLRSAAEMLGDGKSSIVLMTDGREFCSGDPCGAAAEIQSRHPGTPIHIIDITGQAKAECVADLSGGRSYKPEATDDLAQVVRNAFRGADAQCRASGDPATTDAAPR